MDFELKSFLDKHCGTIEANHILEAILSGSPHEIMLAIVDVAWRSQEITYDESEKLWEIAKKLKLAIGNKNDNDNVK